MTGTGRNEVKRTKWESESLVANQQRLVPSAPVCLACGAVWGAGGGLGQPVVETAEVSPGLLRVNIFGGECSLQKVGGSPRAPGRGSWLGLRCLGSAPDLYLPLGLGQGPWPPWTSISLSLKRCWWGH